LEPACLLESAGIGFHVESLARKIKMAGEPEAVGE
jgi:hypothetical protein